MFESFSILGKLTQLSRRLVMLLEQTRSHRMVSSFEESLRWSKRAPFPLMELIVSSSMRHYVRVVLLGHNL